MWLAALDVSWAQELCIYMFIWMAKFGAAYGVRTGIHVGVDLLVNRVPVRSRKQVILFALLCGAFFTGMIASFGASFVGEMFKTGQQSNDLEAPMWIIYLAIPLGSGLMCFRFLQVSWFYYWTGELPHHNEAHVEGIEIDCCRRCTRRRSDPGADSERKVSPLGLILIMAPILISDDLPWREGRHHRAAAGPARRLHLRAADRADADRHTGFDRARSHRADVPVHADHGSH